MVRISYKANFLFGVSSPQQENYRFFTLIKKLYHPVCKYLPAHTPVGICLSLAYCQHRVHKQNTAVRPLFQISVGSRRYSKIGVQLLVNVLERRRNSRPFLHRKAKSVSLTRSVIGILPDNDSLYTGIRRIFQRIEYVVHIRIYPARTIFCLEKLPQFKVVLLFKFVFKKVVPLVSYINHFILPLCFLFRQTPNREAK